MNWFSIALHCLLSQSRHSVANSQVDGTRHYLQLRSLRHAGWVLGLSGIFGQSAPGQESSAQQELVFTEQVLPILREHCFECHSHASGEASGNLMVDSLAAMTGGGTRGAALRPGKPDESLLLQAIEYTDTDLQMPPTEQLNATQISTIRQWIESGAAMPVAMRGEPSAASASPSLPQAAAVSHWAYQPLRSAQALSPGTAKENPVAPLSAAVFTPIDDLVVAQLNDAGLQLSPLADRPTLLRRLTYDLTGLPPTLSAIADFVSDARDDTVALEAVVDRLLASPSFGERWARMWMDVARYADNKGYVFQEDREYPGAYQYRDWLINAFNQDLPYDQFVTQQLAADVLTASRDAEVTQGPATANDLAPLGFLTLGRRFLNNKNDIIDDRIDVVSRGLMGMTLACARCHDHKYDPLTQADYYALYGVFLNTEEPGGEPWPHRLVEAEKERDAFILIRGSPGNRGDKVARRFVSILAPEKTPFAQGSGRLELAENIVSPTNPLTARVIANRIWTQLTGSSLVESPSDFGLRSAAPLQLDLLDHLASTLIRQDWSLKRLIRGIVSSHVYRQASQHRPEASAIDPLNALYWKMNRRRLDFEAFRDTLLMSAGELDTAMLGKSAVITTTPFARRRTVYAYIDRQNLPQLFRTFDLASPDTHTPQRAQTSVPQQGLYLLNSHFVADLSLQLARRAEAVSAQPCEQSTWMFQQVMRRLPDAPELELMTQFLSQAAPTAEAEATSSLLTQLAGGLLAANELAHID